MSRTHLFTAVEKDWLGWQKVGCTWMDPSNNGTTVAHDCLEHFPNDRGRIEDELQALGAAFFVRTNVTFPLSPKNVSYDVVNTLLQYGNNVFVEPCKARCGTFTSTAATVVRGAYAPDDVDYTLKNTVYDTASQRNYIRAWITYGYQRAKRRYHRRPDVGSLFEYIANNVRNPRFVGDALSVTFDVRTGTSAKIKYGVISQRGHFYER